MDRHDFTINGFDCDEGVFNVRVNYSADYSDDEYEITIDSIDQWQESTKWWLEWTENEWVKYNAWFLEKAEEDFKKFLRTLA